jgi:hypothetical protein
MRLNNTFLAAVIASGLVGCGGGGGGGGGGPSYLNPYSDNFSPLPNSIAQATLYQQNFSYTNDGFGTATGLDVGSTSTGSVAIGFGPNVELKSISVNSSSASFSINESNGIVIPQSTAFSEDLSAATNVAPIRVISVRSLDNSDYSSYGLWVSASNLSGTAGVGSTFSSGLESSAAQLPPSGSAIYSGGSLGIYFSPIEGLYFTESDVQSAVNFSGRSLSLSSLNTTASFQGTGPRASSPLLNFSGSGVIVAGSASFSGSVQLDTWA